MVRQLFGNAFVQRTVTMDFLSGFNIVTLLLFLVAGVFFIWLATLEYRLERATRTLRMLFTGRSGVDLEQLLRDYAIRMERTDQTVRALNTRADQLESKSAQNVQHVGV